MVGLIVRPEAWEETHVPNAVQLTAAALGTLADVESWSNTEALPGLGPVFVCLAVQGC